MLAALNKGWRQAGNQTQGRLLQSVGLQTAETAAHLIHNTCKECAHSNRLGKQAALAVIATVHLAVMAALHITNR